MGAGEIERARMRSGPRRTAAAATALAVLIAAAAAGVSGSPEAAAASAGRSKVKPPILSPRQGERLPARPLTLRVRAGKHVRKFRAQLNGQPIARYFSHPSRRRVRRLEASPDYGLKHRVNVLTVRVKRRSGAWRSRRVRFWVRRGRPLAAAGLDRTVETGPVYLSAAQSRVHPSARTGGPRAGLDYRWAVLRAPRRSGLRPKSGARGHRPHVSPLPGRTSRSPVVNLPKPGSYVFRVRVKAPDDKIGRDVVKERVVPRPMVTVQTQASRQGGSGEPSKVWGIQVGQGPQYDASYDGSQNPWLQIVVLRRDNLQLVANKSYGCTAPNDHPTLGQVQGCIDRVRNDPDLRHLDDTEVVLAANHPRPSSITSQSGYDGPVGVPEALRAIGVGISDRSWPDYVEGSTPVAPGAFSAIGIPTFGPGTAAEAFARSISSPCNPACPSVGGYLVQDFGNKLDYVWSSSARVPFDTRAEGSSSTKNVIQIGDRKYSQQLGPGQRGGYQVVVADRYDISKADTGWFPTDGDGVDQDRTLGLMSDMLTRAASTHLVSALNGRCVDVPGGHADEGARLQMYDCNSTVSQDIMAVPGISPGDGQPGYELHAMGKCLDSSGNHDGGDNRIELHDCNGAEWQQFRFDDRGRIVGMGGFCLDIVDESRNSGAQLRLSGCNDSPSQRWRTDSSKLVFVAPVGKPFVKLSTGTQNDRQVYEHQQRIGAVADALAAMGGTQEAFNEIADHPNGAYGMVGWAGIGTARAPEESGELSDQMPDVRIAGTLSTDNWQRYGLQDEDPSAGVPEPATGIAGAAADAEPADIAWAKPTAYWPDQEPANPRGKEEQAAVACISQLPGIDRGGDLRAAYFADIWSPQVATGWDRTDRRIGELEFADAKASCGGTTFEKQDFNWAQTELHKEIGWLLDTHEYLEQLVLATGNPATSLDLGAMVDDIAHRLKEQRIVAPRDEDHTALWAWFVVDTAFDIAEAVPAVGPLAKKTFEKAKELISSAGAIESIIHETIDTANEATTQEPGPEPDELSGAVIDVKKELAKRYKAVQDDSDAVASIVAGDPRKLEEFGTLRAGCRDNPTCPANWRLDAGDVKILQRAQSLAAERTTWTMLFPAEWTAWQLREFTGEHTPGGYRENTRSGFQNAAKYQCEIPKAVFDPKRIRPFANAQSNGMAAFRVGWGDIGTGRFDPEPGFPPDRRVLRTVWVLGKGQGDESYTVPTGTVFDRLFSPIDPGLEPGKGGLGVDKLSWYRQTFTARQYNPKDPAYYWSRYEPNCAFTGSPDD